MLLEHGDGVSALARVNRGAQASDAGADDDDLSGNGVHGCDSGGMRRAYDAYYDAYGPYGNVWDVGCTRATHID
ncbi:hypothetical protein PPGU19_094180 (plasmid) [Paraburkholderia sp. PGU19]|nr:hypothetical protein PPGU19_094180 [Paraburkholderia sp. PGU19]